MIQAFLEMFTTEQKAAAMLANPIIEFIFMLLFLLFVITVFVHFSLFMKLRTIRGHIKETNRMDIEPLRSFKEQFVEHQSEESVHVETFVQEKFSSWRLFNVPVINLIKMIQATVSIFILIGVLGTFIGLTISLGSINSASDQLVENVASVLSGIDVAFYTSIVGMGFSLIMTVLVKVLNTEYMLTDIMLMVESNLEENEQYGMGRLINVSESIHTSIINLQDTHKQSLQGIVEAFSGFKDYTEGLQQSAKDLATFNDGLSNNLEDFQTLFHEMKSVTVGFSKGTTQLNENFASLFSYFKKSDQRNERIAKSFEETHVNIQNVSKVQIDTFAQFEDVSHELKEFTSALLKEQSVIQNNMNKITEQIQNLVETMGTHNNEFKQIFGDSLNRELSGIVSHLGELSGDFDKLGSSIGQLPQALEVINQTQHEYRHLLSDRFEELKEFNQSFGQHIKDHASESIAFERQLQKVSTTFEQMGIRNSQLVQDMSTTLSQMDRIFDQREHHLESSVGVLKDTLSKYVNNVEGSLSNRLDQMVRQIGNTMNQTSDGIQREFADIRQLTEDIQQSNARLMQQLLQDLGREIHTFNRNMNTRQQQPVRIGWNQDDS